VLFESCDWINNMLNTSSPSCWLEGFIVHSHWDFGNEIVITSIMNVTEENLLYCHEALEMLHTINEKVLLSEQLWKNYEALKFCNTFPMEKLFNYNPLKLTCWHKARQVLHPNASSIITIILCTKIIVNIKRGFPSCGCCFSSCW